MTQELHDSYDAITEYQLAFGDYWIVTRRLVGLERKTPSDLLSALSDGRLDAQVLGLIDTVDVPILLLHGELRADGLGKLVAGNFSTGWSYDSVLNKLQTYQEMGVRLQFAEEGDDGLIRRLLSLAHYFSKSSHTLSPRVHGLGVLSRETHAPTLALAQLPGVGVDRARALLSHFGSLQAVTNASIKDLRFVPGIGPKVAKSIHDSCH